MWKRGPAAITDADRARLTALDFVATDRVPQVPDLLVLDADLKLRARAWSFSDADTVLAWLSESLGEVPTRQALGTDAAGVALQAMLATPATLADVLAWITTHSESHSPLLPVATLLHGEALARIGQAAASEAVFADMLHRWPDHPIVHRARFNLLNFNIWPIPSLPEVRSDVPPVVTTAAVSSAPEIHHGPEVRIAPCGLPLREIPAGRFTMGTDDFRFPREGPARSVVISAPYFIGVWPVTRAVWQTMEPGRWPGLDSACPALGVSWLECHKLIDFLNAQGDWRYRLPTEAEWARAAAGGTDSRFPWGDKLDITRCNLHHSEPVPVASYDPNGFGLYDVIGNGLEWVADAYAEDALSRLSDGAVDPFVGPEDPGVLQRGLRVQRSMFPAPRTLVRILGDRFCRTYGLQEQGFGGRGLRLVAIPPAHDQ